jgi:hypothetical protein
MNVVSWRDDLDEPAGGLAVGCGDAMELVSAGWAVMRTVAPRGHARRPWEVSRA